MKKVFFLAALLMASTSAHAGDGVSIDMQGKRIELPSDCDGLSCLKAAAPLLSGLLNRRKADGDAPPAAGADDRRFNDDDRRPGRRRFNDEDDDRGPRRFNDDRRSNDDDRGPRRSRFNDDRRNDDDDRGPGRRRFKDDEDVAGRPSFKGGRRFNDDDDRPRGRRRFNEDNNYATRPDRAPPPAPAPVTPPAPPVATDTAPTPPAPTETTPPAPAPAPVAATTPERRPEPASDPNSPIGVWAAEDNRGNVRIEQCGDNLCGFAEKGGEKVLINMKPQGSKWSGRVMDPDTGKKYDATMMMKSTSSLRLQGCAFGGMFCGGQTWKRVS